MESIYLYSKQSQIFIFILKTYFILGKIGIFTSVLEIQLLLHTISINKVMVSSFNVVIDGVISCITIKDRKQSK